MANNREILTQALLSLTAVKQRFVALKDVCNSAINEIMDHSERMDREDEYTRQFEEEKRRHEKNQAEVKGE